MTSFADVLGNRSRWSCWVGDVLAGLALVPDNSVHCCATSPPYWGLRDYGAEGQIGSETTPELFVERLTGVFREVRRVLHPSGTLWLNIGDTYITKTHGRKHSDPLKDPNAHPHLGPNRQVVAGYRHKNLVGVPWMLAFALRADGWELRAEDIWHKPGPMPSSTPDRCTTAHEQVFQLTKSPTYFYDQFAVNEGRPAEDGWFHTRNRRSVWKIASKPFKGAHFAAYPPALVRPLVMASTSERGVCPACGNPWTRQVEKTRVPTRPALNNKTWKHDATGDKGSQRSAASPNRDPKRHVSLVRHVGWQAGCGCGRDPVPAVVLDPFAGTGTTLQVAVGLGRRALGIELQPDYLKFVRRRMKAITPTLF